MRAGVRVIDGSGEVILFLGIIHELCGLPVGGGSFGLRFDPFLKLKRCCLQHVLQRNVFLRGDALAIFILGRGIED